MTKTFLTPAETARKIAENGTRVMTQPLSRTLLLSLLAGFYVAFGAQLSTVVTQDTAAHLGMGLSRFVSGSVFSLGLILVAICGAELFTGNTLLTKAALHGQIPWSKIGKNWSLVLLGNLIGSLFFAWLMFHSQLWQSGSVAEKAVAIASAKTELPFTVALIRGLFCNWLVCLAVFMYTSAQDIVGKILATYVPVMAFVASGFEHSVANMYYIPTGIFIADALGQSPAGLTWGGFLTNLIPVILGNILGGVVFVSFAYWFVYLRSTESVQCQTDTRLD